MEISRDQLFSVLIDICDEKEMYVTVAESAKGALKVAGATLLGGLLGGRSGLLAGSAVGGAIAYATSNDFKFVGQVLMELQQEKKDRLLQKFNEVIGHLKFTDTNKLKSFIKGDAKIYEEIVNFIKDFVTSDLNMSIKN